MSTQDKKSIGDRDDAEPTPDVVEGPHESRADVAPEMSQLQNQPHGQAGQPQNRPAHEGHQGITPIQPDSQIRGDDSVAGESPQRAFTHSDPPEVVDTAYTGMGSEADQGSGDQRTGSERTGKPSGEPNPSGEAPRDGSRQRDASQR